MTSNNKTNTTVPKDITGNRINTEGSKKQWLSLLGIVLFSLLEYHTAMWIYLDLPMRFLEEQYSLADMLQIFTRADYPLAQNVVFVVLLILNSFFLSKGYQYLEKNDFIISVLFSVMLVLGYTYDQCDSLELISAKPVLTVAAIACILGYSLFWCAVLSLVRRLFSCFYTKKQCLPAIWDNHPFWFPAVVLIICWLPYTLVKYPVGMEYDAFYQIQQVLNNKVSASNPIVSTLFFGYTFLFGRNLFGSINAGLFFVVLCQMGLCACMDAYAMLVLHRKKVHNKIQIVVLFTYVFSPFIARYTTSIVKDALYAHAVLFLVAALADLIDCSGKDMKKLAMLSAAGAAVCFFRNNGIILCISVAGVLLVKYICHRSNRATVLMLCSSVLPIVVYLLFSKCLIPALGIQKYRVSELLSIPFQQTARYVVKHEEDITEEEKMIIDAVLDYETIKTSYDPRLSDPVKKTYRGDEEALAVYLKYWAKEFLSHPKDYISATLNNCYGFFYPAAKERSVGIYTNSSWDLKLLEVEYSEDRSARIEDYIKTIQYLEALPIFWGMCNVASQVWLFVWIFTSKIIDRTKFNRTTMVPVFASVVTLVGMPTFSHNGFRYALPIVIALPFLVGLFLESQFYEGC